MTKDKFLDNVGIIVETWLRESEKSRVVSIVERARWVCAMMLADVAAEKHGYTLVKAIAYFMLEKAAQKRDDIEKARWYLKDCSIEHMYIRQVVSRLELPEPEELQYCSVPEKVTLPAEIQKAIDNNQAAIHIHLEASRECAEPLLKIDNNNGGSVTIHNTEIKKDEYNASEP